MPDPSATPVVIDTEIAKDVQLWRDAAARQRREIDRLNDRLDHARSRLAHTEAELAKLEGRDDA